MSDINATAELNDAILNLAQSELASIEKEVKLEGQINEAFGASYFSESINQLSEFVSAQKNFFGVYSLSGIAATIDTD